MARMQRIIKRKDFEKMKIKTTQKEIKSRFKKVVCVGYCNLQHLLFYQSPTYYTARREGWASDIYIFDDIAISMGYVPFGNIKINCDILNEYEEQAKKIKSDYNTTYIVRENKVNGLLKKFIEKEVKK